MLRAGRDGVEIAGSAMVGLSGCCTCCSARCSRQGGRHLNESTTSLGGCGRRPMKTSRERTDPKSWTWSQDPSRARLSVSWNPSRGSRVAGEDTRGGERGGNRGTKREGNSKSSSQNLEMDGGLVGKGREDHRLIRRLWSAEQRRCGGAVAVEEVGRYTQSSNGISGA